MEKAKGKRRSLLSSGFSNNTKVITNVLEGDLSTSEIPSEESVMKLDNQWTLVFRL